MNNQRFKWPVRPISLQENMVISGNCRFTVLTERLLRIEYSNAGEFVDNASQSVFYRDFPKCDFSVYEKQEYLFIETPELCLKYKKGCAFKDDTLSIALKHEPASEWHFGEDSETLGGTVKTLDGVNDFIPLEQGLCARCGFSILDDSDTMLLGSDGWIEVRPENSIFDIYFFGYGYEYRRCIKDYYRLTGIPPLLPAYALGNWWSRYHKYTQAEYTELIRRFETEDIPFSVAVIDMDWHITQIPGQSGVYDKLLNGWTGYTWNTDLFPDYREFLDFLHDKNYKTSLNLHPAAGVRPHEAQYTQMARAMNIDPESGEKIPFDILSKEYMANYFDILHHPYEENGVDFWWMDWQQGTDYRWIHAANRDGNLSDPREKLDPLWMLNHLHILDISRNGKRPMFFSRYSGPGSHRYPVGFSGDTYVTWEALKFQPFFTASASNVGYGWWSHDIGGHMRGLQDEELTVRWFQLGVFSPINRLHSGSNEFIHKEPWFFSPEYRTVLEETLRLRHRLFPYLYTMNYRCHNELEPLVQPMYYSHPKCGEAYNSPNQYWFGSELMVSALTEKGNSNIGLSQAEVWFPAGHWFDFFSGLHYHSARPRKIKLYRELDKYPVFAKSGAIVPMAVRSEHDNRLTPSENMEVLVFPGENNQFKLYEDAGDGFEYKNGSFCKTKMELIWDSCTASFNIHPAIGDTSLIPQERQWNIILRGFSKDTSVKIFIDGNEISADTAYDSQTNSLCVKVTATVNKTVALKMTAENLISDNPNWLEVCKNRLNRFRVPASEKKRLLDVLKNEELSVRQKMLSMYAGDVYDCNCIFALREMLTLTQEEFQ